MNFIEYFKEKIIFISINIIIMIFTSILLKAMAVNTYAIVFTNILNFIGILIFYIYDYSNKRKYYNEVIKKLEKLHEKYMLPDVVDDGSFLESKIFYNIIEEMGKSMKDKVSEVKRETYDYREYIELWIHEVKTPIAACKLLVENNKNEITKSIEEELEKVEDYIEQSLFYSRSNNIEKDYIIKELPLKNCINNVIKRNANILIEKSIKIDIKDCDRIVYSDAKWVEFILHQIISNSIKYMEKKEKIIKIYAEEKDYNVILYIEDNGIGINKRSINRVFEKGYTGENGRIGKKSTGIGLFLCKKLALKLGLSIRIQSVEKESTTVSILFPINRMMIFEN
ncbi:Sensor histidine kinase [Clostridium bornimense]|uniref:histidine kinase n=1 Tax=Clostridium bornimense TaxID=1216932 RepID=W6S3S6_9CLOT|nr:ATP-binding protein [Clostridium bornimense]CDM68972.1 Sensor histidine kinase [Clostridium bornimense]